MEGINKYWMEDVETASRSDLAKIQLKKLKSTLAYCQSQSKFYQKKFQDADISVSNIKTLGDFTSLPFTSRDEIVCAQREKSRLGGLMCTNFEEPGQTIGMTGVKLSASGQPIRVIISVEDAAFQGLLAARGLFGAGVEAKNYLYLMDYPQFNILYMHLGLGSINLGSKSILVGMERAERNSSIYTRLYPPNVYYISPSYSKFVTRLLKQTKKLYPIHAVLGWSEPGYSLPSWKERFREMWGEVSSQAKITISDVYGMIEVGLLGFECVYQTGLHGFEDAYIYEIINTDTKEVLAEGEEGELVVTHLYRYGMPLIRYRTGDITSIRFEKCACGRTHLRLMGIKGRLDQEIKIGKKKIYQSEIEEALGSCKSYSGEFNIVTKKTEELSCIELNILQDSISEASKQDIEATCSNLMGVPVRAHLKPKEDLLIFLHRSQKIISPENYERFKKEAINQQRNET